MILAPIITPLSISFMGMALHIAIFMAITFCTLIDESDDLLLCIVLFQYSVSVHVELDVFLILIGC